MKSASGMPTGASSSSRMMPVSSLFGDAQLEEEQTIASDGTPRILVGFSSASLRSSEWPSNSTEPAQGEDDLLPLVADVDVRGAGDELLDRARRPR